MIGAASLARLMTGARVPADAARRGYDAYHTVDGDAVRALLRSPAAVYLPARIWEPACGAGDLARLLEADGRQVVASDLLATGYGQGGVDFLRSPVPFGEDPGRLGVVTNPPFTLHYDKATGQQVPNAVKGKTSPVSGITQFALRSAALGLPVCALLHKTQFVNTAGWASVAQQTGYRPAFFLPLGWRPDWTGGGSPTMDVAWTVWVSPDRAPAWPHTALARLPRPA